MKRLILLFTFLIVTPAVRGQGDSSCGFTWRPAQRISSNYNGNTPHLAVKGDTIHCVWESGTDSVKLLYARSIDGGITFSPPRDILTDPARFFAYNIYPVIGKTFLFVFWQEVITNNSTPYRVWMMKSSNAGETWSAPSITYNDSISGPFNVANTGDTIAIMVLSWTLHGYTILHSANAGVDWSRSNKIILGGPYPSITIANNELHMARQYTVTGVSDIEVLYSHSSDLGDTWSDSIPLSTLDNFASGPPVIASDTYNKLYVAWRDSKYGCQGLGGCSILVRYSFDAGEDWSDEIIITDEPKGEDMQIAVRNNTVAVTWAKEVVFNSIFHTFSRISLDSGITWCNVVDVTPNIEEAGTPAISIASNSVCVLWQTYIDINTGGYIDSRTATTISSVLNAPPPLKNRIVPVIP